MLRSERLKNIELLILNRPDAGNSISSELTTALLEKLERLKSDKDLHSLIITGAGDKFFCTGGDIKQYQLIKDKKKTVMMLWSVSGRRVSTSRRYGRVAHRLPTHHHQPGGLHRTQARRQQLPRRGPHRARHRSALWDGAH